MERPYYIDFGVFRLVIHKLVTSKYFDLGISAVIGLNVITMAMEFYMMPQVTCQAMQNYKFPTNKDKPLTTDLKFFPGCLSWDDPWSIN